VKPQPGDISIVDKLGTLLLWCDIQYASRLTANSPARYTFPSAGQILEARRTVKERR
jgi:hypothetical protein